MAVVATCFALPVLVLVLLHSAAVQGVDHCYLVNETCPDVCCGPHWNATCCFRSNSTNWWRTAWRISDCGAVSTFTEGVLIAIVGLTLAGLVGLILIILFCVLVCKVSCCRRRDPAYIITRTDGQGIPIVSPKEGYIFPGSLHSAASEEDRQAARTQGGNRPMSKSLV